MKIQYDDAYDKHLAIFAIRVNGSDEDFEIPPNTPLKTDHYLHTVKYVLYKDWFYL